MKTLPLRFAVMIILGIGLLGGCNQLPTVGVFSTPTPALCIYQAQDFVAKANKIFPQWDDAMTIASRTSRIVLPAQVSKLQGLRRALQALDAPECAREAQKATDRYMEEVIAGYLAFLDEKTEYEVRSHMETAQRHLKDATLLMSLLLPKDQQQR